MIENNENQRNPVIGDIDNYKQFDENDLNNEERKKSY